MDGEHAELWPLYSTNKLRKVIVFKEQVRQCDSGVVICAVSRLGIQDTPLWIQVSATFKSWPCFFCHNRRKLLGNLKHKQMLADYHDLVLPQELEFCRKLRVLDLSYSLFLHFPSNWKMLIDLQCTNLSYNWSLFENPKWSCVRNRYLRSLNVMGCSRIVERPPEVIKRLNTTLGP